GRCRIRCMSVAWRKVNFVVVAHSTESAVQIGWPDACCLQFDHQVRAFAAFSCNKVSPRLRASTLVLDVVQLHKTGGDARFDWALSQQTGTKAMNGASKKAFEVGERPFNPDLFGLDRILVESILKCKLQSA